MNFGMNRTVGMYVLRLSKGSEMVLPDDVTFAPTGAHILRSVWRVGSDK